ncbi:(2Fe-2S)-binding protein [Planococcus beigongshangi]|uniref:(2Fe-2S)-binding protein n=1 Tax=Planococcus beigongshangi TaxID=2782536 RepID=UPI00193BE47D|nr:(2Fe-2S)-binding protein [Planococcus beigongshangi]
MDKSTIVCKCEEINIDEIETALKAGACQFDDIKRLTRCGMGPCQSKVCTNMVREIIAAYTGEPMEHIEYPKNRMPIKITRLGVLVANQETSSVVSVFKESVSEVDTNG